MILDLTVFNEQTLEVIVDAKTTVHIKKPTQKLAIQMIALQELEKKTPEQQLTEVVELVSAILSNNTEGKQITTAFVSEKLNYAHYQAILQAYSGWMSELQTNPT